MQWNRKRAELHRCAADASANRKVHDERQQCLYAFGNNFGCWEAVLLNRRSWSVAGFVRLVRSTVFQPEQRLDLEHRKSSVHNVYAVAGLLQAKHDRRRADTNRLPELFRILPSGQLDSPRTVQPGSGGDVRLERNCTGAELRTGETKAGVVEQCTTSCAYTVSSTGVSCVGSPLGVISACAELTGHCRAIR